MLSTIGPKLLRTSEMVAPIMAKVREMTRKKWWSLQRYFCSMPMSFPIVLTREGKNSKNEGQNEMGRIREAE